MARAAIAIQSRARPERRRREVDICGGGTPVTNAYCKAVAAPVQEVDSDCTLLSSPELKNNSQPELRVLAESMRPNPTTGKSYGTQFAGPPYVSVMGPSFPTRAACSLRRAKESSQ